MSITTKRGDRGETCLYWGGNVSKDSARIEANGMLDELSSFLGLLKSVVHRKRTKIILTGLQKDLLLIGAEIATKTNFLHKLKKRITPKDIRRLEEHVADLEKDLHFRSFALGGENLVASGFDLARVLARKLERCTVTLTKKRMLKNPNILVYLNRLSDLLYLLACNHQRCSRKNK
ncbi:MAG: cob(I)yrinic acid a,c-diamide adenosyltransferase [Candidatus Omnitrophica bacterium]|nr:cob(I)yrinic acid a,c-diamide adenosyltransferase [Candidatus Omnitrophota bacterium]